VRKCTLGNYQKRGLFWHQLKDLYRGEKKKSLTIEIVGGTKDTAAEKRGAANL